MKGKTMEVLQRSFIVHIIPIFPDAELEKDERSRNVLKVNFYVQLHIKTTSNLCSWVHNKTLTNTGYGYQVS